jgi:hypothetical protein
MGVKGTLVDPFIWRYLYNYVDIYDYHDSPPRLETPL